MADPDAEVEIGTRSLSQLRARVAEGDKHDRIFEKQKAVWDGFAGSEEKLEGSSDSGCRPRGVGAQLWAIFTLAGRRARRCPSVGFSHSSQPRSRLGEVIGALARSKLTWRS